MSTTTPATPTATATTTCDVLVVGGGPAGLGAAVALARSLRSVVVVDAGEPRNAPAAGAHNVLGQEGIAPLDLLAAGRREAEGYGARIRPARAVTARRTGDGFEVGLDDGSAVRARRLVLATGLADELPGVPGLREGWGRTVLHCPYCHGYEVRGRRLAVLATGPLSVHQTLLFRQLSDDVTLLLHTAPEPGREELEQLAALGVPVVRGAVERIAGGAGPVVVLADGRELAVDAVAVAPRFLARAELFEQLGGRPEELPVGRVVPSGPQGRTDLPGVWVAGNAGDLSAVVVAAAAAGVAAGAGVNADLVAEDARAAVRARAGAALLDSRV